MEERVLQRYEALLAAGELERDSAQAEAVARLQALASAFEAWRARPVRLWSVFSGAAPKAPHGLYIHGKVGRGKTILMDLFFEAVAGRAKRRVHFHQFMAETHDLIFRARQTRDGDPIAHVAREITAKTALLCFDELHVTDIADAMILGRLFKALFEARLVVVATSNLAPADLYRNGLNRQLFLPFIDLIGDRMEVLELAAAKDYRADKLVGRPLYFTPLDGSARLEMDRIWRALAGAGPARAMQLEVKGRSLHVPRAAMGAARFDFRDLCGKPLGTLDYLQIARSFHTVMIDNIPVFGPARRDQARRFINLIDTLYDARVSLIASAEVEPGDLYSAGRGADLFARTASRLIEMRSKTYLAGRSGRFGPAPLP